MVWAAAGIVVYGWYGYNFQLIDQAWVTNYVFLFSPILFSALFAENAYF